MQNTASYGTAVGASRKVETAIKQDLDDMNAYFYETDRVKNFRRPQAFVMRGHVACVTCPSCEEFPSVSTEWNV